MLKLVVSMIAMALMLAAGPSLAADKDSKGAAKASSQKEADKLDLNTAKEEDLMKLPGIAEARAKAIIKNRPYKGKDELVERKIIPASVYDKIKDRVIAKHAK